MGYHICGHCDRNDHEVLSVFEWMEEEGFGSYKYTHLALFKNREGNLRKIVAYNKQNYKQMEHLTEIIRSYDGLMSIIPINERITNEFS